MAKKTPYEVVPQLGKLRDDVLFGDVWEPVSYTHLTLPTTPYV